MTRTLPTALLLAFALGCGSSSTMTRSEPPAAPSHPGERSATTPPHRSDEPAARFAPAARAAVEPEIERAPGADLSPDPQAGRRHHAFDEPKRYTRSWNAPERDAYQKPAEIIAAMRIAPGQTVADLGAGTGYLLPHLARAVGPRGRVFAVDVEPAMIEYLQEAAERESWSNVEPVLADLDRTNLKPQSVDRLVTLNTWHHIEDRVAYARRLADIITIGGELFVVDFIAKKTPGFGPPLKMRLSAERVADELRAAGWEAEIIEETLPRHYIVRAAHRR